MPRPHIYRVGDRVRIVNPRIVDRVGYPTTAASYYQEMRNHPRLGEAAEALGLIPKREYPGQIPEAKARLATALAWGAARAMAELKGMGGNERSIHYYNDATWPPIGTEYDVLAKRYVRTGVYYGPSGGKHWTDYGWEYEYEPGGLTDAKTHVLLMLACGEIEACDVEPVIT